MQIKVYGPGCAKCQQTLNVIQACVAEKGGDIVVEKITDIVQMYQAGILSTPAVVIDGRLVMAGEVPKASQVMQWLDGQLPEVKKSCGCGCCG